MSVSHDHLRGGPRVPPSAPRHPGPRALVSRLRPLGTRPSCPTGSGNTRWYLSPAGRASGRQGRGGAPARWGEASALRSGPGALRGARGAPGSGPCARKWAQRVLGAPAGRVARDIPEALPGLPLPLLPASRGSARRARCGELLPQVKCSEARGASAVGSAGRSSHTWGSGGSRETPLSRGLHAVSSLRRCLAFSEERGAGGLGAGELMRTGSPPLFLET